MKIDCLNVVERVVQFELPQIGELTPQLRWVLMNGHCHSLALAIHRITDWPLVARVAHGEIEHVHCQMPDGRLLDAEVAAIYPDDAFDPGSDPGFQVLPSGFEFSAEDGWLKSIQDVLVPFAQMRLEEVMHESDETFHYSVYPFLNPT